MHWSTYRALQTIAKQGHARLDAALLDALSRDADSSMRRPHVRQRGDLARQMQASQQAARTADQQGRATDLRDETLEADPPALPVRAPAV